MRPTARVAASAAVWLGIPLIGAEVWARHGEAKRLRIPHATRHHALKPFDESDQEAWGDRTPAEQRAMNLKPQERMTA